MLSVFIFYQKKIKYCTNFSNGIRYFCKRRNGTTDFNHFSK